MSESSQYAVIQSKHLTVALIKCVIGAKSNVRRRIVRSAADNDVEIRMSRHGSYIRLWAHLPNNSLRGLDIFNRQSRHTGTAAGDSSRLKTLQDKVAVDVTIYCYDF